MSACLNYEPFDLQPACVALRFRPPAPISGYREILPTAGPLSASPYRENPERLTRAAQAFLLRVGS